MRIETVLLILMAGCASASQQPLESATALQEDGPCLVRLDHVDTSEWQQVAGSGFVFCVPAEWRQSGPHRWAGRDAGVSWRSGRLAAFTSDVEADEVIAPAPAAYGKREHFTESIGGVLVRMWRTEVNTRNVVGGQWVDRVTMHMAVSGTHPAAVDRHVDVLRTVRIMEP
jgi:hypothetical protein